MSTETNEKLKKSKPGETPEETNSKTGIAGLYRHPNGQELITLYDPLYGDAQSEAAIRVGFEFVREVDLEKEVHTIVIGSPAEVAARTAEVVNGTGVTSDDLKGINARLNAVESESKAKDDEILALKAKLEAKNEQGATKDEAATQTEGRLDGAGSAGGQNPNDGVLTGGTAGNETDTVDEQNGEDESEDDDGEVAEKALDKQNASELAETATREGVEITPELDTKAKLRAAIEAKREEKKGE